MSLVDTDVFLLRYINKLSRLHGHMTLAVLKLFSAAAPLSNSAETLLFECLRSPDCDASRRCLLMAPLPFYGWRTCPLVQAWRSPWEQPGGQRRPESCGSCGTGSFMCGRKETVCSNQCAADGSKVTGRVVVRGFMCLWLSGRVMSWIFLLLSSPPEATGLIRESTKDVCSKCLLGLVEQKHVF